MLKLGGLVLLEIMNTLVKKECDTHIVQIRVGEKSPFHTFMFATYVIKTYFVRAIIFSTIVYLGSV